MRARCSATIVPPRARRLNQFPELAHFVREDGQADRYADLNINYVNHHNPDLILFDKQNTELHRIDLTRLRTSESMHKLMLLLGLKELCQNTNPSCEDWAASGECGNNPAFMSASCRKSCGLCGENATMVEEAKCRDLSPAHDCQYWSTMGQCTENVEFMRANCAKSCGVCGAAAAEEEPDIFGKDEL